MKLGILMLLACAVVCESTSSPRRHLATCAEGTVGSGIEYKRSVFTLSGLSDASVWGLTIGASGTFYMLMYGGGSAMYGTMTSDMSTVNYVFSIQKWTGEDSYAVSSDESIWLVSVNDATGGKMNTLVINCTTGALVRNIETPTSALYMNGGTDISQDNTYYVTAVDDTTPEINLCKVMIADGTSTCFKQSIALSNLPFLAFDGTTYVYLASHSDTDGERVTKLSMSDGSVGWNNLFACGGGTCIGAFPALSLSSDQTVIYCGIAYVDNASTKYSLFNRFNNTDGSVIGNRHSLVAEGSDITSLYVYSDYVYITFFDTVANTRPFGRFDPSSDTMMNFYSGYATNIEFANIAEFSTSSQFYVIGGVSGNIAIIKTDFDTFSEHQNYIAYTYSGSVLASGDKEPSIEAMGAWPSSSPSFSVTTYSITSVTATFNSSDSYTNDAFVQAEQMISVTTETNFTETVNITCSQNGNTEMTYALTGYEGGQVPDWISIDSSTGELSGRALKVEKATNFTVNIDTTSASFITSPKQQKLTIEVKMPEMSAAAAAAATVAGATVAAVGCASVGASASSGSSPSGLWSILHQLKNLMVFPIMQTYLPSDIELYISGNSFVLMNFNFIPIKEVPYVKAPVEWLHADQSIEALEELDLESRSTFANCYMLFWIIIGIISVHLLLKFVLKKTQSQTKCARVWNYVREKLYDLIFYMVYFRLILEAHESLLFSSLGELKQFDVSEAPYAISSIFAILVAGFCLGLIMLSLYYFVADFKKFNPDRKFMAMEIYADIRNNRWARSFAAILLTRRTVFVLIIIFISPETRDGAFIICMALQFLYLLYMFLIRPFEPCYMNMLEITNEVFFSTFLSIFYVYDSEEDWTDSRKGMVLNMLLLNSLAGLFIILGDLVLKLVKFIIKKLRGRTTKTTPFKPDRVKVENANMNSAKDEETAEALRENVNIQNVKEEEKEMDTPNIFIPQKHQNDNTLHKLRSSGSIKINKN